MTHNDFDETTLDDEGFDDKDFAEIDALIEHLKEQLSLIEGQTTVYSLDLMRVEMMRFSCAAIKRSLQNSPNDVTIVCKQDEFTPSMGYVNVEGVELAVLDAEWFARAAEFANNTEVYPLKENKVRLTFTFYGMLIPA